MVAWRLLSRGSVEERIAQRAADKLGLEAAVGGSADVGNLSLHGRTISREDTLAMLRDAAAGAFQTGSGERPRLTDAQVTGMPLDAHAT